MDPTSPISMLDQPITFQSDGSATFGIHGRVFTMRLKDSSGKEIRFSNDAARDQMAVTTVLEILKAKKLLGTTGLTATGSVTVDARGVHTGGSRDIEHTEHEQGRCETIEHYRRFAQLLVPKASLPPPPLLPTWTPPTATPAAEITANPEPSKPPQPAKPPESPDDDISLSTFTLTAVPKPSTAALPPEQQVADIPNFNTYIDLKFFRQDVKHDGNCLFHACALGTGKEGPAIRHEVFAHAAAHPEPYRDDLLNHLLSEATEYANADEDARERHVGIVPKTILEKYRSLATLREEHGEEEFDRALSEWLHSTALEQYLEAMKGGTHLGGEIEIKMLAGYLNAPVAVYDEGLWKDDGTPPCRTYGKEFTGDTVHLLHDEANTHYMRLYPKKT